MTFKVGGESGDMGRGDASWAGGVAQHESVQGYQESMGARCIRRTCGRTMGKVRKSSQNTCTKYE